MMRHSQETDSLFQITSMCNEQHLGQPVSIATGEVSSDLIKTVHTISFVHLSFHNIQFIPSSFLYRINTVNVLTVGRSEVNQLVPLRRQHSEYSMVKKLFAATMNTTIKNVSRIQNVELWENFTRKRKWMSHKNEGQVEERLLFHGTSSSSITGICNMNFDMRLHGKHGALYGKGVYFAKNATYSDRYVTEAQFSKQMILARVLVGEYMQGKETYRRPPEKAPNILYDSCVDDISNPEIFVIFEKDQMYPEYLLEYEKE
uniref:Poly [ADP-ribose] polymerase n=1 Tax=Eptatretus burgeri TaxID=7764 RepID=A0A8C4NAB3_EPTBU